MGGYPRKEEGGQGFHPNPYPQGEGVHLCEIQTLMFVYETAPGYSQGCCSLQKYGWDRL